MDRLFDLAAYAERIIEREPGLELAAPRESIAVCFRIVPDDDRDADRFNVEVRQWLQREGRCLVNYSTLSDGRVALRFVAANPELNEADVDRFFETLLSAVEI